MQPEPYTPSVDRSSKVADDTLDFSDFICPVWGRRWLVLAIALIGASATYAYFVRQAPSYSASTRVFFQDSSAGQLLNPNAATDPDRNLLNQATLLTSRDVAAGVAQKIGYTGPTASLLQSVQAEPSSGSDFILVTAKAGTAPDAARLANAFAQAFISIRSANLREAITRELRATRERLQQTPNTGSNRAERDDMAGTIRELEVARALPSGTAQQIDPALPPARADSPRPVRNAIFALVLALLTGVGVTLILERFDRRIKRVSDMPLAYDLPVLGVIPIASDPAPSVDGRPALARELREPFRSLRTAVRLSTIDLPLRSVLVVSAIPGEGKSTVVRNLALTFAESGANVAVLDFDLRRPALGPMLKAADKPGFTDVLEGSLDLDDALRSVRFHVEGTTVASVGGEAPEQHLATTSGPAVATASNGDKIGACAQTMNLLNAGTLARNPQTLLATEGAKGVLDFARQGHDITLIDTSPLLAVSDATSLVGEVDGVIIVARMGMSTADGAKRLTELLHRVPGARLLGLVVNGAHEAGRPTYYGR